MRQGTIFLIGSLPLFLHIFFCYCSCKHFRLLCLQEFQKTLVDCSFANRTLLFFLGDRVSVVGFKDVFERLRPSHALEDVFLVKLKDFQLIYTSKGGLYGFVSSHSTNAFLHSNRFRITLSQNKDLDFATSLGDSHSLFKNILRRSLPRRCPLRRIVRRSLRFVDLSAI